MYQGNVLQLNNTLLNVDIIKTCIASVEINTFGVPDTMSCTNQFVPDVKEIVMNLYWTMTQPAIYFKAWDSNMFL